MTKTTATQLARKTHEHPEGAMAKTYSTRDQAIQWEILRPIEAAGVVPNAYAEYDVPGIARAVLGDYGDGYAVKVTDEEFWTIVANHATR